MGHIFDTSILGPEWWGQIQGLSQRRSENNGLLLPKYESEGLPDPTGGSTDVVHLLI